MKRKYVIVTHGMAKRKSRFGQKTHKSDFIKWISTTKLGQ